MFRSCTLVALFVGTLFGIAGCKDPVSPGTIQAAKIVQVPEEAELQRRIDAMVAYSRDHRLLDSNVHNAWQVVHGMLAYGRTLEIQDNGKMVPAMDWALGGGKLNGWGLVVDERGPKSTIIAGKLGAGHQDQWLGYLSQSGLQIDDKFVISGKNFTTRDLLDRAMADVHDDMEAPWVIMATSHYLPIDATWKNSKGEEWSTERLVELEASRELTSGACGATHKLYSLAAALNAYLSQKQVPAKDLTGAWKKADDRIQEAIRKAHEYQNPDGSFSTLFFARPSTDPVIGNRLYATGHMLEFIVFAATDEQFRQPWVAQAAYSVTRMLEETRKLDVECGQLYHAAHGLLLYSQRRWPEGAGKAEAATTEAAKPEASTTPVAKPDAATTK